MDNFRNIYMEDIIGYILCFTTTHFLWNQVTTTQTVIPFSSTIYIHNSEIICYIMIDAVLEIIYLPNIWNLYGIHHSEMYMFLLCRNK